MWQSDFTRNTENPNIGSITSNWTGIVYGKPITVTYSLERIDISSRLQKNIYISGARDTLFNATGSIESATFRSISSGIDIDLNNINFRGR